jgi:hypothetical protein
VDFRELTAEQLEALEALTEPQRRLLVATLKRACERKRRGEDPGAPPLWVFRVGKPAYVMRVPAPEKRPRPRRRRVGSSPKQARAPNEPPEPVRLRELRRRVSLIPPDEWRSLNAGEKAAGNALTLHLYQRCRQKQHPALEGDDRIFLTRSHVQRLLKATSASNTGEKAAAAAIKTMQQRGWIEDTGETKKPRRPPESVARAVRFNGPTPLEGGRDSQPTLQHAYWWRVFRVPAITQVIKACKPLGAYGRFQTVPQRLASLSAFLLRQGVILRPSRGRGGNPGSVQWAFHHSGPP